MKKSDANNLMSAYRKTAAGLTPAERRSWNRQQNELWLIADQLEDRAFFESLPVPKDKARRLKELVGSLPILDEGSVVLLCHFAHRLEERTNRRPMCRLNN